MGVLFLFVTVHLWGSQSLADSLVASDGRKRLSLSPLVIETTTGAHIFQIEEVVTPEAQAKGLMNRQSLAPDRGMLFDIATPRNISMWMSNTLIPLDILFVNAQGRIIKISANAVPGSLQSIRSGSPVRSVVELLGGTAAKIGAAPGDRIRHRLYGDTLDSSKANKIGAIE